VNLDEANALVAAQIEKNENGEYDLSPFYPSAYDRVLLTKIPGWELNPHADIKMKAALIMLAEFNAHEYLPTDDSYKLGRILAEVAMSKSPDEFAQLAFDHLDEIETLRMAAPHLVDVLLIGLGRGIMKNSGTCALNLGALYYAGRLVKQDYALAAILYQTAFEKGEIQGLVNLGYIYELGRIGQPDYQRAYECFALAAVIDNNNYEAAYKLGDMYAPGRGVKKNDKVAVTLWEKSLSLSSDVREEAHPAIRLAPYFISSDAERVGLKIDPMLALMLYQKAEIGLRKEIDDGQDCYQKQLEEAIKGQESARLMLDFVI